MRYKRDIKRLIRLDSRKKKLDKHIKILRDRLRDFTIQTMGSETDGRKNIIVGSKRLTRIDNHTVVWDTAKLRKLMKSKKVVRGTKKLNIDLEDAIEVTIIPEQRIEKPNEHLLNTLMENKVITEEDLQECFTLNYNYSYVTLYENKDEDD